jgi:hypothetical protein
MEQQLQRRLETYKRGMAHVDDAIPGTLTAPSRPLDHVEALAETGGKWDGSTSEAEIAREGLEGPKDLYLQTTPLISSLSDWVENQQTSNINASASLQPYPPSSIVLRSPARSLRNRKLESPNICHTEIVCYKNKRILVEYYSK